MALEVHYTTNGKPASDRTKVGIVFSKERPKERVVTNAAANGEFVIPPGNPAYAVDADESFYGDAKIVSFQPHMHVRVRSFRYDLVQADGTRSTLFDLAPLRLPLATDLQISRTGRRAFRDQDRVLCDLRQLTGNPWNPDPKKEVKWGDQSWEEMMIGCMELAVPVDVSLMDVLVDPRDRPQPEQPKQTASK